MVPVYCIDNRKQAVEIGPLGIRSDDREIPHPIEETTATHHFIGHAQVSCDGQGFSWEGAPMQVPRVISGLFAACLFDGKIAVIVAPESERSPAYWFAVDLASATVSPTAQIGTFKKRPGSIVVANADLSVRFVEPSQFFMSGLAKPRQADVMLEELHRHSATPEATAGPWAPPVVSRPDSGPSSLAEAQPPPRPEVGGQLPAPPPPPAAEDRRSPPPMRRPAPSTARSVSDLEQAKATSRVMDGLFYLLWGVGGLVGLAGFISGLAAGGLLYVAVLAVFALLWWPFVKIGGFFFFLIELLEIPPVAVAVVPWMAFIAAAMVSVA